MDMSAFHFLRPAWLLAALPALWLWWQLLKRQHPLGAWAQVMEERFARLFTGEADPPRRWPVHGLLALWIAAAVALAGPTWVQKPVPAHKTRTGVVIVFDLSLSMLARDIPPSRLQRARFKVEDLVRRNPQQRFGLVAYAGSAHTITPLAEDSATLLNLLPSLNPMIMPKLGSRPDLAMEQAHRLFEGAGIKKGHIIWITDDLDQEDALRRFFARHGYTLAILAVGTAEGAPIPLPNGEHLKDDRGHTVIARLPWQRLEAFARALNATLTPITLDDADVRRLEPPFAAAAVDDKAQPVTQWQDAGPYLVVLIALLGALAFRRGWIFALLPVLLLPAPPPAQAQEKTLSDWRDIFRTPDQQGYIQWQQKHYGRACDLFEDPAWKGVACARAGRLLEARRALEKIPSKTARDWYNLGTLQARQGDLQAAERALRQALKLQPDFPEARDNLDWVRRQRHKAQQMTPEASKSAQKPRPVRPNAQDVPQQAAQAEKDSQTTPKTAPKPQKPTKNSPQDQQKSPSEKAQNRPSENFRGTPSSDPAKSSKPPGKAPEGQPDAVVARPTDQPGAPNAPAHKNAVPDNWLQLIPDEPGLYLQRKFEYQLQRQNRRGKEKKQW